MVCSAHGLEKQKSAPSVSNPLWFAANGISEPQHSSDWQRFRFWGEWTSSGVPQSGWARDTVSVGGLERIPQPTEPLIKEESSEQRVRLSCAAYTRWPCKKPL